MYKQLSLGHLLSKEREQHHSKYLRTAAKCGEQRISALTSYVICEEIYEQVACYIECRVYEHDGDDHRQSLVICHQRMEHLTYAMGLHYCVTLLLYICHANSLRDGEHHCNQKSPPLEADAVIRDLQLVRRQGCAADGWNYYHSKYSRDGRTHARAGSCKCRQILPLLARLSDGRDHGPVRNIHQRVCDSPQEICHCQKHLHPTSSHAFRHGEHRIEDNRVQHGSREYPRSEPSPSASGLCHHDTHDRIVKCIKHSRHHQHCSYEH